MPKQRTLLVAANWKMHKTHVAATAFADSWKLLTPLQHVKALLCPAFVGLEALAHNKKHYLLGAQNMAADTEGAFTGEVSANMLQALGVDYVILGHSERRQLFGETDAIVHKKVSLALHHHLIPIICVGENLEQRNKGQAIAVVHHQLEHALKNCALKTGKEMVIAYEPLWAIGTGLAATPEIAQTMHAAIRAFLTQRFTPSLAETIKVIYGGSLKPDNALALFSQPDIDGGLVGGAALHIESFYSIISQASIAYSS